MLTNDQKPERVHGVLVSTYIIGSSCLKTKKLGHTRNNKKKKGWR